MILEPVELVTVLNGKVEISGVTLFIFSWLKVEKKSTLHYTVRVSLKKKVFTVIS